MPLESAPDLPAIPPRRRWFRLALTWCIGLGLLAWLLSLAGVERVLPAMQQAGIGVWLVTIGGLLFSYGLRAARLQVVTGLGPGRTSSARILGVRSDVLRVILMHNAAVNLLPMRAGELSFPWLASRHLGLSVARALACLLWMRVQDLAVLMVLGLLWWPALPWWQKGLALLGLIAGWMLASRMVAGRLQASPVTGNGWRARLGRLRDAVLEPDHHRPLAWLLTAANWLLKLAVGAVLLSAISGQSWMTAWFGALGGELAAVLPVQGPAGFGTYEAGVWLGFAASMADGAAALATILPAALALHACFLVCAVLAGGLASLLGASPVVSPHESSH
ncbi:MAG TPA: lysylphosphatidylglycerol synthase domain-containing protein [Rhodocyclaceae bacterium]|nr:lysylphosphatidylglycerol synthase domain-containing protein [Rhodocyclaceae bacterium]